MTTFTLPVSEFAFLIFFFLGVSQTPQKQRTAESSMEAGIPLAKGAKNLLVHLGAMFQSLPIRARTDKYLWKLQTHSTMNECQLYPFPLKNKAKWKLVLVSFLSRIKRGITDLGKTMPVSKTADCETYFDSIMSHWVTNPRADCSFSFTKTQSTLQNTYVGASPGLCSP